MHATGPGTWTSAFYVTELQMKQIFNGTCEGQRTNIPIEQRALLTAYFALFTVFTAPSSNRPPAAPTMPLPNNFY
jgi:hypothetical protein